MKVYLLQDSSAHAMVAYNPSAVTYKARQGSLFGI